MGDLSHIIKKDNTYYVVDGDSLTFNKLTGAITKKLSDVDEETREQYAKKIVIKTQSDRRPRLTNSSEPLLCNRLVLNVTSNCNLRCKYCYANVGLYATNQEPLNMKEKTLINSFKTALKIYPRGIKTIQFFGGEPLINRALLLNTIPQIYHMCKGKNIEPPQFTIVTNGTLIDDDYINLFNKYFSSVTISIDGCKEINDKNRVFASSSSSVYDTIVATISKINHNKRNFSLCIEGSLSYAHLKMFENGEGLSSIDDLFKLGADSFHFAPVFDMNGSEISMAGQPTNTICSFFDELTKRLLMENSSYRLGAKKKMKALFVDKEYNTNICSAGASELTVDVNGLIYPCFMFKGIDRFVLGDVNNFNITRFEDLRDKVLTYFQRAEQSEKCTKCWAKKMCGHTYSHCLGARYLSTGDICDPIDLGCKLSKTVIERLLKELSQ